MPFTKGHTLWKHPNSVKSQFKKGTSVRVGMKHSTESIEKIIKNRTGKSMGEKNPSWKGGITTFIIKVKRLTEHKQWQKRVLKRDNVTCRACGQKGGNKTPHHLIAFSYLLAQFNIKTIKQAKSCDFLWQIENGITLCSPCHEKTPNYSWKARVTPTDNTVYKPVQIGELN